jgi:hypothetical protein
MLDVDLMMPELLLWFDTSLYQSIAILQVGLSSDLRTKIPSPSHPSCSSTHAFFRQRFRLIASFRA